MDAFRYFLETLLYKTVSIYVTNYSNNNLIYCGTILNVTNTYISLVIDVGKREKFHKQKKPFINFNKQFNYSSIIIHPGSIVEIPIDKIEAIVHYPI